MLFSYSLNTLYFELFLIFLEDIISLTLINVSLMLSLEKKCNYVFFLCTPYDIDFCY